MNRERHDICAFMLCFGRLNMLVRYANKKSQNMLQRCHNVAPLGRSVGGLTSLNIYYDRNNVVRSNSQSLSLASMPDAVLNWCDILVC